MCFAFFFIPPSIISLFRNVEVGYPYLSRSNERRKKTQNKNNQTQTRAFIWDDSRVCLEREYDAVIIVNRMWDCSQDQHIVGRADCSLQQSP